MKGKVIFCVARPLDEDGGRIEKIERGYLLESAPAEITQNFLIAVSDRSCIFQVNGKNHLYNPGDVMFFKPGESVAYKTLSIPKEGTTVYRGIEISPNAMNRLVNKLQFKDSIIPVLNKPVLPDNSLSNEISAAHTDLLQTTGEDSDHILEKLITYVSNHPNAICKRGADRPMVRPGLRRVLDYIHTNYKETNSLESLAEIADLSMPRFCHVFAEKIGISPHSYIIQYRIHKAKSMLLKKQKISEVACETGFVDQAHFSRHFKRLTALTPGQYLTKGQKQQQARIALN